MPVVGGPYCGDTVKPYGAFIWLRAGGIASPDQKRGGQLYRAATWRKEPVYVFSGDTYYRCTGCGAYHAKDGKQCRLCGTAAPR